MRSSATRLIAASKPISGPPPVDIEQGTVVCAVYVCIVPVRDFPPPLSHTHNLKIAGNRVTDGAGSMRSGAEE